MMAKNFWMYIPWDDDKSMEDGALAFTERLDYLKDQNKVNYNKIEAISPKYIQKVRKHISCFDDFYIAGDCARGVNFIGSKDGKKMTAHQLAQQMVACLPKDYREIHIWACYSGHGMEGVIAGKKIGLAYEFWKEMHNIGYNELTVYGYRFAVLDPFNALQIDLQTGDLLSGFESYSQTPELFKPLPGNPSHWMTGLSPQGKVIAPAPLPRR